MIRKRVLLPSTKHVTGFVQIVNRFDFEFDLVSGRYVVDGKSIMGIFSLDLMRPCELRIHADPDKPEDRAALDDLLQQLGPYLITPTAPDDATDSSHSPR